eukprot:CAMPEP_0197823828 /NCGR_PEP_ID=MMETSP1437-20131217/1140_1 /TAXON_ID=49252 ORGANISM="Eucampia antarctica, Strain CCMP1452" /NCGR_SAMPLE_ID=MMETSP1437 /ASSEMBLY_ACC=CAM_ASM_001096 /LENGTH=182 /DNA_ID=CAMNT_0043423185 /DNA_START=98 /DNA_END=646 /DNA_ORIENTATION=+
MKSFLVPICLFVGSITNTDAFTAISPRRKVTSVNHNMAADQTFELDVDLPPTGSGLTARLKFPSILDEPSQLIKVRYELPFGLDVTPQNGLAVCTKDGTGGEKVGDVLRYSSQWTLGLPRDDGIFSSAAAFSGGVSWQCSFFDVIKATKWEEVVDALTSNVAERTDQVVLIFERPSAESNAT